MERNWYIGCSGFHYREWKESFYPSGLPQRLWFSHYAEQFNTLELNMTFYRFPQLSFLEGWYARSPAGFCFSAKMPRLITHYRQGRDCASETADFYALMKEGLKEKLGCLLFQLPPQLAYSEEALERFCTLADPELDTAFEFRHESWWNAAVYETLRRHRIAFCGHSHPRLPDELVVNGPMAYYRFHGVPKLYYSAYDETFLREKAESLKAETGLKKAYLYFNNTAAVAAPNDARLLRSLLS